MGRARGSVAKDREVPADELRDILKPIFDKLRKAKVPEERLPNNDALVSMLLNWIDDDKVNAWIKSYAETMRGR